MTFPVDRLSARGSARNPVDPLPRSSHLDLRPLPRVAARDLEKTGKLDRMGGRYEHHRVSSKTFLGHFIITCEAGLYY